jgi:hypothetical protein
VRTRKDQKQWNEWGYLDYAEITPRLKSFHSDILRFRPKMKFDAIYSVSVIEHMPRAIWEKTLLLASKWLKNNGLLLLTLDLKPNTDALWNLSEGEVVESDNKHGTLKEFLDQLKSLGFVVEENQVKNTIPYSRTDVAFIACRLVKRQGIKSRIYKFCMKIMYHFRKQLRMKF